MSSNLSVGDHVAVDVQEDDSIIGAAGVTTKSRRRSMSSMADVIHADEVELWLTANTGSGR